MSPLVSAKVTSLRKTLAARIACVRFLSRVNPLVNLQVADTIKAFAAEWADEPLLLYVPPRYSFVQLGVI